MHKKHRDDSGLCKHSISVKKRLHEALKLTSFRFELTIFRNRVTKRCIRSFE